MRRRDFFKSSAASAAALTILPSWSAYANGNPNERLRVAIIGAGGRGEASVETFGNVVLSDSSTPDRGKLGGGIRLPKGAKRPPCEIVAICDVDWNWSSRALKAFPNVPKYRDYRKMFDEMADKIDAVAVCVPDHMHYAITAWAIKLGKHVFCEKPLARTVWEIRELARLSKEKNIVTQMGNQGATSSGWRVLREWYDAGLIGEIEGVYAMTPCPIWPQGNLKVPSAEKIPAELDYDLWLGVAPQMPYSKSVLPFNWRGLRNYASGPIGDMGCHIIEPLFNAFNLSLPTSVKGVCDTSTMNEYTWAEKNEIFYEFDSPFGVGGKIKMNWYDGGNMPESIRGVNMEKILARDFDRRPGNAIFIVGKNNTVKAGLYGNDILAFPREKMIELKKNGLLPKAKIPRSEYSLNPHLEFAAACLWGSEVSSSFERGAPLAETSVIGAAATVVSGTKLTYDAKNMRFDGNPEADKYLKSLYEYRKGFLPS